LIAPNHSAWASNNESPHLSNAEANLILHQQQMEKHYLEMQQRQLDLRQKYQTIIQNTNAKQTTFSLFMVNNQPSIPIYTVDDLINVAQDMSASYILMSDLDLSCIPDWTPLVGPSGELFMGTFDGNGYSISNLRSTHGGLFYGNYGGIIKNIKLVDVNIESTGQHSHDVGAIAGFSEQGLITNCSVTGRIVAYYDASGITAYVSQTTISSCKDE
jgi:hypothetical protein